MVVAVVVAVVVAADVVVGVAFTFVCNDAGGCLSVVGVVGVTTTVVAYGSFEFLSAAWMATTNAGGVFPEPSLGCVLSIGSIFVVVVVAVWVVVVGEGVKGATMVFKVDGGSSASAAAEGEIGRGLTGPTLWC